MSRKDSFYEVRDKLLTYIKVMESETVHLNQAADRIIAEDVKATLNVPLFNRSAYDGYAYRANDVQDASKNHPVTLRIIDEIPAGTFSNCEVVEGSAVKILTGAPIPKGADVVSKYEVTTFSDETVTVYEALQSGSNIVKIGEDVQAGTIIASKGMKMDAGLMGSLASQNIEYVKAYKIPKIAIVSTGSELLKVGSPIELGKIYNSNEYMLKGALSKLGCDVISLGMPKDDINSITQAIQAGLETCDMVILTGGVSVGDYDFTPKAMELAGVTLLQQGVDLKPGMACAFGEKEDKIVCGLSGNPSSAYTTFYGIVQALILKLKGLKDVLPLEFDVTLWNGFSKSSKSTRLLRGKMEVREGQIGICISKDQGNVVMSSAIGCDMIAIVPAGSGPVLAGTKLKGFFI